MEGEEDLVHRVVCVVVLNFSFYYLVTCLSLQYIGLDRFDQSTKKGWCKPALLLARLAQTGIFVYTFHMVRSILQALFHPVLHHLAWQGLPHWTYITLSTGKAYNGIAHFPTGPKAF